MLLCFFFLFSLNRFLFLVETIYYYKDEHFFPGIVTSTAFLYVSNSAGCLKPISPLVVCAFFRQWAHTFAEQARSVWTFFFDLWDA